MLMGCEQNQEFSRLTFEKSAQAYRGYTASDSDQVSSNYRNRITELLREHGIDPAKVTMQIDPENERSVVLSIREGSADEKQLAGFRDSLERIALARENLPLMLSFNLHLPPPGNDTSGSEALEDVPGFEVEVNFDGVQLVHSYGVGEAFVDALERRQPQTEVSCVVETRLNPPVPIEYFKLRTSNLGKGHQFVVGLDPYPGEMNADLVFNDHSLQNMVESLDVLVSMPVDSGAKSDMFMGRLDQIDLRIGSVGKVEHKNGRVAMDTHAILRERCRKLAIDMGRPFTFFMGDTLDRLVSVSSIDPE
ncbi:MAG TPA: hypothetical protein DHU56_09980 [Marinobacter sp.]|jgi:hypothetical protein|nr:hypothetical protein [Marinobacter sp.]